MAKLILNTTREGYGTDQIRRTMTVDELISFLETTTTRRFVIA